MQVPIYDSPQVGNAGIPTPRMDGSGPDAFGAGIGRALQGIGHEGMQVAKEEFDKANAASAMGAVAKAEEATNHILNNPESGYLTTKFGKDALGIEKPAISDIDKNISEIRGTLSNDIQRQAFDKLILNKRVSAFHQLNTHEAGQVHIFQGQEAEALVKSQMQTLDGQADNLDAFNSGIGELDRRVRAAAVVKGLGKEATDAAVNEARSTVYAGLIEQKVISDPASAVQLLKEYGPLIDEKLKRPLETKVEEYSSRAEGGNAADFVFNKMAPVDVNEAVPADVMIEQIRKDDKLSDKAKWYAERRVEERTREHYQKKRADQDEVSNEVYGMWYYDKAGYGEISAKIKSSTRIDNGAKVALQDFFDGKFGINKDKDQANNLQYLAKLLDFQRGYMAGTYGKLSPNQLTNQIATLGPFTDNAMQFVENVNKDLNKAKLTDGELKDTLRILSKNPEYAKLLPKIDKAGPEDKAKMALLQAEVQSLMAASESAPGKGMTAKEAILKSIQNVTTPGKGFWGLFGYPSQTPLYELGAGNGDPATWPKATQDEYIKKEYFKATGKQPDSKKVEELRKRLITPKGNK